MNEVPNHKRNFHKSIRDYGKEEPVDINEVEIKCDVTVPEE